MLLKRGDKGDAVKTLQRGLNRLGSILLVDGDFGAQTAAAVMDARAALELPGLETADDDLQAAIAASPDPFPALAAPGVTFIARFEVTDPRTYRLKYRYPTWPLLESGVTIGIGYDMRFVDRARFEADWADHLPARAIERLARVVGCRGSLELAASLRDIEVPLLEAMSVFLRRSLPQYLADTRCIYPQIDSLPPNRQAALVSLVYNRGNSLTDGNEPGRRSEMRNIRDLLAAGNYDAVANEFESMTRLWAGNPDAAGLVRRRLDEARLWRSGFAALQLD